MKERKIFRLICYLLHGSRPLTRHILCIAKSTSLVLCASNAALGQSVYSVNKTEIIWAKKDRLIYGRIKLLGRIQLSKSGKHTHWREKQWHNHTERAHMPEWPFPRYAWDHAPLLKKNTRACEKVCFQKSPENLHTHPPPQLSVPLLNQPIDMLLREGHIGLKYENTKLRWSLGLTFFSGWVSICPSAL